jgi:hypothetical protein
MKTLILIAVACAIAYTSWNKIVAVASGGPEPLSEAPYVAVYGRDTCGITQRMLADLGRSGVPYVYKRVDDRAVADELHERMQASGLDTSRYGLPVVDVNAEIDIRPSPGDVTSRYLQSVQARRAAGAGNGLGREDESRSESRGSDPLVRCMIGGEETYTLRSQCP